MELDQKVTKGGMENRAPMYVMLLIRVYKPDYNSQMLFIMLCCAALCSWCGVVWCGVVWCCVVVVVLCCVVLRYVVM